MRAIDADALCEDLLKRWSVAETRKEELIKAVMADVVTPIIACQPTIEPEIVRCKDCKHRYIENMTWHCPFGLMGGEDFFCGYGSLGRAERRTDEADN